MNPTPYQDAVAKHGSYRKAAVALKISRTTFFDRWKKEMASGTFSAKVEHPIIVAMKKAREVKRYIFTCAVRGAPVHKDFLDNLIAYAKSVKAELVIGPLTSTSRQRFADLDEEEFDAECRPYISDDPIVVGDRVRFSPELNLTPTCVKPLQGLQTFTKRLWGVFPHTKVSLESVSTHKDRPSKINVTTGAVTQSFYSPTKAGFRASFDHVYGAVIVEVTRDGSWIRHLTPKDGTDGTFYDLDRVVQGGLVMWNDKGVEALVYGDIHVEKLDHRCGHATWGYGFEPCLPKFRPLVEILAPRVQVFHDLMDMTAINYHELDDLFKQYSKMWAGHDDAKEAFVCAREFLEHVVPKAKTNIIVDSNHDYFLNKWLLKYDPGKSGDLNNAELFYQLKLDVLRKIRDRQDFSVLARALDMFSDAPTEFWEGMQFLMPDESYEVMGVELAWHGHRGSNGSRGSRGSFKFVTEKSTTAHLHGPSIDSGSHIVGTSSQLDLGYNQGASNWSHTHGIIYPHGHRTLITMSDGKFWPEQYH